MNRGVHCDEDEDAEVDGLRAFGRVLACLVKHLEIKLF